MGYIYIYIYSIYIQYIYNIYNGNILGYNKLTMINGIMVIHPPFHGNPKIMGTSIPSGTWIDDHPLHVNDKDSQTSHGPVVAGTGN